MNRASQRLGPHKVLVFYNKQSLMHFGVVFWSKVINRRYKVNGEEDVVVELTSFHLSKIRDIYKRVIQLQTQQTHMP